MFGDVIGDALEEPILERETVRGQSRMKVTFEVWIDFDDESA